MTHKDSFGAITNKYRGSVDSYGQTIKNKPDIFMQSSARMIHSLDLTKKTAEKWESWAEMTCFVIVKCSPRLRVNR